MCRWTLGTASGFLIQINGCGSWCRFAFACLLSWWSPEEPEPCGEGCSGVKTPRQSHRFHKWGFNSECFMIHCHLLLLLIPDNSVLMWAVYSVVIMFECRVENKLSGKVLTQRSAQNHFGRHNQRTPARKLKLPLITYWWPCLFSPQFNYQSWLIHSSLGVKARRVGCL